VRQSGFVHLHWCFGLLYPTSYDNVFASPRHPRMDQSFRRLTLAGYHILVSLGSEVHMLAGKIPIFRYLRQATTSCGQDGSQPASRVSTGEPWERRVVLPSSTRAAQPGG